MLWQILAARGEVEARRGNFVRAQELDSQARTIVEFIAEHTGAPERRASFLALPQVRTLVEPGAQSR